MLAPKTPQNPQRSQRCLQDPLANKAARPVGGGGQSLQMEQSKSLKNKSIKMLWKALNVLTVDAYVDQEQSPKWQRE